MRDIDGLYLVMVVLTVISPGPGLLMTLDNALARGWRVAMHGVCGLALGAALMASLSVLGLGVLVSAHALLFAALKVAGAAYLLYLAHGAWSRHRSVGGPAPRADGDSTWLATPLLGKGFWLQTSNPKPILFFLTVLPQVAVDGPSQTLSVWRTAGAIAAYALVLLLVHGSLAAVATRARPWLTSDTATRLLGRASAVLFVCFAALLLASLA
ncbi:MAG: lysine transporter LysE [Betaproteobacteria bacterium HGW-Betaproteobacteria-9]|jgi:threonine/homoserine/homoserine lactone efflux protein|nr:MAG: lysine transporter LysE [Betaproteobacteria bacterium HGW-Betaproteobacteria-9]